MAKERTTIVKSWESILIMATKAKSGVAASGVLGKKDAAIKEMFKQGLHWGHKTSRWHPHIEPFLHGSHRNVHVFDLNKTYDYLSRALEYLKQSAAQGKVILFVGTRGPERELIKNLCKDLNVPGVWEDWVGGTFTNFKEISRRIAHFNELEQKQQSGELEKYTKKERLELAKEHAKMMKKWEGMKTLKGLPDVLFLTNIGEDMLALKEARAKRIPVVAITDSNTDPTLVDYPIPANDDALTSLTYILARVREALLKAQGSRAKDAQKKEAKSSQ